MSRILSKIIIERLKAAYESNINNAQFGFRKNRSTIDGIFIMKNVIDKYSGPFVAVYIDLTAAYDHIPRDFLFKVLEIRTGACFVSCEYPQTDVRWYHSINKRFEGEICSSCRMQTRRAGVPRPLQLLL